ncbi:hypothetical protein Vadar_024335 [Vaccinium darrowii]|uniref:Uncharacterized protein n=1 Tax=Vaccinium darrowii TaxID=229202 RepID=A0ACB7X3B6_9ERIC|nr:hypothetical protein Vadar_024335 [Vaccinium darrowii]
MFRLDEELSKFRIDCDICRRKVKESSCVYHCAKCLYVAHVGCATKGLNGSEGSEDKGQDHLPGNETSHKKAVEAHSPENSSTILCMPAPDRSGFLDMITYLVEQMSLLGSDKSGKWRGINLNHCIYINQQCISDKHSFVFDAPSDEICDGCVLPISAPYYNCPECHLILHKSCGDLPGEIHGHQLHKEHPLTLRNLQLFDCSACKETRTGFAFHCNTCSFYLDIKCSSLPAAIKHEAHEHVLNLQQSFSSMCAARHNCSIDSNVYTCIPCNFNLHKRCALLPRTLAHRYDKHALILKYTPVGLSSNEYYCEICEESVNPKCWFYYCRDCDYSFDPFCICKASQIIHENVKIGTKVIVYQHPCPLTSVLKRYQERWQCNNCRHQNGDVYLECKECEFKLDTFCALKSITVKFGLRITDPTGSIDAVIFADVAEKFFNITAAEIKDNHYRFCATAANIDAARFMSLHLIHGMHNIHEECRFALTTNLALGMNSCAENT